MKMTESHLRQIIRKVIKESQIQNESIEDIMSKFGVDDDSSFIDSVLEENRKYISENSDMINMKAKGRKELNRDVAKKMESKTIELEDKFRNLPEEKKKEIYSILKEIEARKDIASSEQIKRICTIAGLSLTFAPLIVLLIATGLGISVPALAAKFPLLLGWASKGLVSGRFFGIVGLFGLGATLDDPYYEDRMSYNKERIKDLEKRRDQF